MHIDILTLTVLQTGLIYVQFDERYYALSKGDNIDILKV